MRETSAPAPAAPASAPSSPWSSSPPLSRRRFLQSASVAAAAMALAPHALGQDQGGSQKKVGFAIVGLGRFGKDQLLRSLPQCKLAYPAALVSGSPDKAEQMAQKYGIKQSSVYNYENFDKIADNPDVDVVYVVLPNSMHHEYTIRAAKAGKHVLCEKPMANTAKECEEMIAACKAADRKLMIGYRLRYEPHNMRAIEMVQNKEFGPARVIESVHSFNIGPGEWRTDKKLAGGGPVMDLGIYCINACRYLSGEEPQQVNALTYQPEDDERFKTTEAQMVFNMKFKSGLLAYCSTSYAHHTAGRYHVMAERAEITMNPAFSYGGLRLNVRGRGGKEGPVELPQINQFCAEMDHFAECVRNNTEPRTPGEEGLKDMKVIEKLYESAQSGKTVEVS
jgi:predicted dehydrogenase